MRLWYLACFGTLLVVAFGLAWVAFQPSKDVSSTYSFSIEESGFDEPIIEQTIGVGGRYSLNELENWQRPSGPVRVGIQAGHWKNSEVPEELEGLRKNGGGAVGGGKNEQEVVLVIAEHVADQLRTQGIFVDLLPATVPIGYIADAFISIHADGNLDTSVTGFKATAPYRDYSGRSVELEQTVYESYEKATTLSRDPNVSRRMHGYYAFNWRRYEHAIHPMTPAIIIETGFLTNALDRRIIVSQPELAAQGITNGILSFLQANNQYTFEEP